MHFIKLKLTNFKPYFGSENIVTLSDESVRRLVTLNVGPTGNGKTSLSDAILWTLYGENHRKDWKHWVNKLAIQVAGAGHQNVPYRDAVDVRAVPAPGHVAAMARASIRRHR